jgi:hypothetical protein
MYVAYANAHSSARELCGSLYMKIFVYFIKQTRLLAIISKFGGGGDDSILWLSFAQQKRTTKTHAKDRRRHGRDFLWL